MDYEAFTVYGHVSRETYGRLELYVAELRKWNNHINLVSQTSIDDIWQRHIADSWQLAPFLENSSGLWCDFGSGGGLPGIVLAIAALEKAPELKFQLVEVDQRKAVFLREIARKINLNVAVLSDRIEKLPALKADFISARALAPLDKLCEYCAIHLLPGGTAYFLKGMNAHEEVLEAKKRWNFDVEYVKSVTDTQAAILKIKFKRHV